MMNKDLICDVEKHKVSIENKTIIFGDKTYIMGILNVTPDSFSDGGRH